MSVTRIKVSANRCVCDLCDHPWISLATTLPPRCPSCHSREWNGPRRVGRPPGHRDTSKVALPKPTRVRDV
jgi:hypothetical protein